MSQRAPSLSRRVFVDTSAYFALTDARSTEHLTARAIATRLAR